MEREFAVIGGDMRQVHLARLLAEDGHRVVTWGLEKGEGASPVPLQKALEKPLVVLPLPVSRGGKLNLPLTDTVLETEKLWPRLRYDQLIFGGQVEELAPRLMASQGLTVLDYYRREELQVVNAALTAEGAVQQAMENTLGALAGSRCLVIGFGRIGKLLAHRLTGLCARVTVSARRFSDLAWIRSYGYEPADTGSLEEAVGDFDLIFNTVPAPVLSAGALKRVRAGCVLLELASAPGGFDGDYARSLGLRVVPAGGLPGLVAPAAAAAAVRDSIYHILEERGGSN